MPGRALATTVVGQGPRVVLVHGFTQTSRCWGPFLDGLAAENRVVAVDAPGHGGSRAVAADVAESARLLGETAGEAIYVGYSMGGRIALRLALDRPELVRALVLIGTSPGIEDPAERAARRAEDERRAAHLEHIGVAAFVDEWLRGPLFASLPPDRAHRDDRLVNTVAGLASSLRLAGTGAQEPLWSRLHALDVPVLLVVGGHDTKFGTIAVRVRDAIGPNATIARIPGAGHAAHLEDPERTTDCVRGWMRSLTLP